MIEETIAAIAELPDTDNVHCYDYEIRTDALKSLAADHARLKAENKRYKLALGEISDWAHKAYAEQHFQELTADDWKRADSALASVQIPLGCVSASVGRHILKGVGDIAREALGGEGTE